MTPGALLLFAGGSLTAGMILSRWAKVWLAFNLIGATGAFLAAVTILCGAPILDWQTSLPIGGEPVHFHLDSLAALFLALVGAAGGAGAVFAQEYWPESEKPRSAARGRFCWSGLLLSMASVLVMCNGLHFLIAWELFTVCAYFLIRLDEQSRESRAAGRLFLLASHAGTACLFAFFATLAARTGSWDLSSMRENARLAPLFWLALAGFGVKAGLFPLHIWLPSAHANAPSHVSAIMSGVALKLGIYGILRFSGWLPVPVTAGWVMVGLGAAGALFGIVFGLAQNDLKRLLAYCSVENIGIITVGLGAAILGGARGNPVWAGIALAGALLHVWNHGVFKALLFFGSGSILHGAGTREMSRLGGLWRKMPLTAALFGLGSIAVCALPPLNGFVSEWLLYLGLFEGSAGRDPACWALLPAVIMLAMAGAVALAAFIKANGVVFLGAPRTKAAENAHECGRLMRAPMIFLGVACLTLGLGPTLLWPAIARAVNAWNPQWAFAEPPAPLAAISEIQIALALAGCAAGVLLWQKARANGLRAATTWGCGYALPTTRMQYTSGSFGGLVSGWFEWLLQPECKARGPGGLWPSGAFRLERVPETILERVIAPCGNFIMELAGLTRRLQHGRLPAYIFYVVAGLCAMGMLVWLGGPS